MVRIFFSFRLPSLRFFLFLPRRKKLCAASRCFGGCSRLGVLGDLSGRNVGRVKIGIGNGLDRALAR